MLASTIISQTYPEQFQQHSITKSAWSNVRVRIICSQDRALVYNAVARLQAAGLAYRGCRTNRFLVVDAYDANEDGNNVRSTRVYLTSPAGFVSGLPREELAARAEEWHWDALHCLFAELDYNAMESADSRLRWPMISHLPRSARTTKVNCDTLHPLSALNHNDTDVLFLPPLPCLRKQICIPAMPTMPLKLMLASTLHPSLFLDKNSMPSPWSVTMRPGDIETHYYEEDGDGKRTTSPCPTLWATFILPKRSVGIISTDIHTAYSLRPSSATYSHVDHDRERQVVWTLDHVENWGRSE